MRRSCGGAPPPPPLFLLLLLLAVGVAAADGASATQLPPEAPEVAALRAHVERAGGFADFRVAKPCPTCLRGAIAARDFAGVSTPRHPPRSPSLSPAHLPTTPPLPLPQRVK